MARWLVKTEPDEYSFADLQKEGRDVWDGVRNHAALKHMRSMKVGDEVLVYHTGKERAIVGLTKVVREAYPDPQAGDPKWVVVPMIHQRAVPPQQHLMRTAWRESRWQRPAWPW